MKRGHSSRSGKMFILGLLVIVFGATCSQIIGAQPQSGAKSSEPPAVMTVTYPIVDTGQVKCYNNSAEITCPAAGQAFYDQDAQTQGHQPSYTLCADGLTVTDNVTGLTWQRSSDTSSDGAITAADKLTCSQGRRGPRPRGSHCRWSCGIGRILQRGFGAAAKPPQNPNSSHAKPQRTQRPILSRRLCAFA